MKRHLGLLAKYWEPGQVKTRLAAAIGRQRASQVHRACCECLLERLADMADRRTLVFWPPQRRAEFLALAGQGWQLEPQVTGHLGDRLRSHVASALAAGAQQVVLLGSDSPTLPLEQVAAAFELLERKPVVLGPAEDGGYWLLGVTANPPDVFDSIDWGSGRVLQQTVDRLTQLDCQPSLLATWYDVDRAEDLDRLRAELATAYEPPLVKLREQLDATLND